MPNLAFTVIILFFIYIMGWYIPEYYNNRPEETACIGSVVYITQYKKHIGLTPKLHIDGRPYICVDTDTKVLIK